MLRNLYIAAPLLHLKTALIQFTKSFVLFGTLDEGESTMFQQHKASELLFVYSFVSCFDNNGVTTATFAFVSYGTSVSMVTSKGGFTLSYLSFSFRAPHSHGPSPRPRRGTSSIFTWSNVFVQFKKVKYFEHSRLRQLKEGCPSEVTMKSNVIQVTGIS
jgi:hypothetical protein